MAEIKIDQIGPDRKEAKRLGLMTYWGEKPCKRHHMPTMRYTKGQQCVQCTVERNEEWRISDPERKIKSDQEYHARPHVKQKQYEATKAKRAADPQKRRDEENARYARNPEPWKRANERWVNKNPKAVCLRQSRRRARKNNAEGNHTLMDLEIIFVAQNGHCAYFKFCGRVLTRKTMVYDHIIPLDGGGSNDRTNLQGSCRSCNASKAHKPEADWLRQKWGVADPVAWRAARPPVIFCDEPTILFDKLEDAA